MSKRIFVSYTNADYEAVSVLVSELKQRGFDVWFAPKDLIAGDSIPGVVFEQIKSVDSVIVMLSRSSINARWVINEMNTAIALRNQGSSMDIIPVLLDSVEIPTALINFKAIDLTGPVGQSELDKLSEAIERRKPQEKSYAERFLEFTHSLIAVGNDIDSALTELASAERQLQDLKKRQADNGGQHTQLAELQQMSATIYADQISSARERLNDALRAGGLASFEEERILAEVDREHPPQVLTLVQKNEAVVWARRADEELIALAAFLYKSEMHEIEMFLVGDFLRRWSSVRGQPIKYQEYDEEFEWRQSQLANRAVETRLLIENPSRGRGAYAVRRRFERGPNFAGAGRAAYLFVFYNGEKFPISDVR